MNNRPACGKMQAYMSAYFFLFFLSFALLTALYSMMWASDPYKSAEHGKDYIDGTAAREFEDWFGEQLIWEDIAINIWGTLRYALFNTGQKGVIVGKDGWLFTREEFETPRQHEALYQQKLEWIQTTYDYLESKDIPLVIALLPSKARVYPEFLPRNSAVPQLKQQLYTNVITEMDKRQIPVVNIFSMMEREKQQDRLFLKTDTHWTPAGARLTAKEIAKTFTSVSYERVSAKIQQSKNYNIDGDLSAFIPTGVARQYIGPAMEGVEKYQLEKSISSGGLFGDVHIPFALIGTSYSAIEKWHFLDFLIVALQADVLNLAKEGKGPFSPMHDFLAKVESGEQHPDFVIWEVPERFFHVDYPDLDFNKFKEKF